MSFFSDEELSCPCCDESKLNSDFLCVLLKIRSEFDHPMIVTSSYRCERHNDAVGGVSGSKHLQGLAVDVYWEEYSAAEKYQLLELLMAYDIRGIGLSDEFIHFDMRAERGKLWFY